MATSTFLHRHRILRHVLGRPRLFLCALIGLLSLTVLPETWRAETRLLSAWNLGVLLYIASATHLMRPVRGYASTYPRFRDSLH